MLQQMFQPVSQIKNLNTIGLRRLSGVIRLPVTIGNQSGTVLYMENPTNVAVR